MLHKDGLLHYQVLYSFNRDWYLIYFFRNKWKYSQITINGSFLLDLWTFDIINTIFVIGAHIGRIFQINAI